MNVEKTLTLQLEASSVLAGLCRALSELLSHLPFEIRRPTDLQRALELDYKLCWQIINIVRTHDPLLVSQYVPGSSSIKKLLTAARAHDVPGNVLMDVDQAFKDFLKVVTAHSGDRQAFDSMLAAISGGDAAESLTMQHRRNAFRSESQIWGVQVDTHLRQEIIRRSPDGNSIEKCFINAKYGLRQLRAEIMPMVHGYRDPSIANEAVEPLDTVSAGYSHAPIIAPFSTNPLPRFCTVTHPDGWICNILDSEEVGRRSRVNLVFGMMARGIQLERNADGSPALISGAAYITPTELSVLELIVHRDSFGPLRPQFTVSSTSVGADVPQSIRRTQQFLTHETVLDLGPASQVAAVSEVPRYLEQLAYVFKQARWNPAEFDVYRVKMEYPILHTTALVTSNLVPRGKKAGAIKNSQVDALP